MIKNLLVFFVASISVSYIETSSLIHKIGGKAVTFKSECKKLKCPSVYEPLCTRVKYLTTSSVSKSVYVVMVNKCEMKYIACHEGMKAEEVPMSLCDHETNVTEYNDAVKKNLKTNDSSDDIEVLTRPKRGSNETSKQDDVKGRRQILKGDQGMLKPGTSKPNKHGRKKREANYYSKRDEASNKKKDIANNEEAWRQVLSKNTIINKKAKAETGKISPLDKNNANILRGGKKKPSAFKPKIKNVVKYYKVMKNVKNGKKPKKDVVHHQALAFFNAKGPPDLSEEAPNKLKDEKPKVVSDAEDNGAVYPPNHGDKGRLSNAQNPPGKDDKKPSQLNDADQPRATSSVEDEGLYVPGNTGGKDALGDNDDEMEEVEEGMYIPPQNFQEDIDYIPNNREPHEDDEMKDYMGSASKEEAGIWDDNEGDPCTANCPVGSVMVCAKCKHDVYRTFLSVCHMKQFSCKRYDEDLQLMSLSPCTMSAPYLAELETAKLSHTQDDDDPVLRYYRCQHYANVTVRPWSHLNCTFDP